MSSPHFRLNSPEYRMNLLVVRREPDVGARRPGQQHAARRGHRPLAAGTVDAQSQLWRNEIVTQKAGDPAYPYQLLDGDPRRLHLEPGERRGAPAATVAAATEAWSFYRADIFMKYCRSLAAQTWRSWSDTNSGIGSDAYRLSSVNRGNACVWKCQTSCPPAGSLCCRVDTPWQS